MPIAIQENLLPGDTIHEKFENARHLRLDGIELHGDSDFAQQVPLIAAALAETNLRAAAVNLGKTQLIHPDFSLREAAIVRVRKAMGSAIDLGAQGVIFMGHYAPDPVLPNLYPYKSAEELEANMLLTQLRGTLCDLAYAMGTQLLLAHADHKETHLLSHLDRASVIRKKTDDHPHLKIATNLRYIATEAADLMPVLSRNLANVGYIHLNDSGGVLPGQGQIDYAALAETLSQDAYSGWLSLAHPQGFAGDSQPLPMDDLAASLDTLRRAGIN